MSSQKLVIVEDEPDILELLCYTFQRDGFVVFAAADGLIGLDLIKRERPDLALLDLMLPTIDGLEICRNIKSDPLTQHTMVIMLTAKHEESDIVLGLGVGADDYVAKPFSPRELNARVQAVLRRGISLPNAVNIEKVSLGSLAIDSAKHKVTVAGDEVTLTATEFRLLFQLASNPGRLFSREQLLNAIGGDIALVDRNIDVHIRCIRKKLELESPCIETVRGFGYRMATAANSD